jgi:hypothetical protein
VTNGDVTPAGAPPRSGGDARRVSDVFEAFAAVLPAGEADVVRRVGQALAEAATGPPPGSKPEPDQPPSPRG